MIPLHIEDACKIASFQQSSKCGFHFLMSREKSVIRVVKVVPSIFFKLEKSTSLIDSIVKFIDGELCESDAVGCLNVLDEVDLGTIQLENSISPNILISNPINRLTVVSGDIVYSDSCPKDVVFAGFRGKNIMDSSISFTLLGDEIGIGHLDIKPNFVKFKIKI